LLNLIQKIFTFVLYTYANKSIKQRFYHIVLLVVNSVEHWFSSPKFCSPSVAHFISGYQETTDYAKWSQMYSKGAIVFSCFRGFTAQLTVGLFYEFFVSFNQKL